jgi:hypothetical protein
MATGEAVIDLENIVSVLPLEVSDRLLDLILIFKAIGIAAIVYFLYVIVMGILTYRRMKKVESIEEKADSIGRKVELIDKKLNKLLKHK